MNKNFFTGHSSNDFCTIQNSEEKILFERVAFWDFSRILRHALFACMISVFGGTGMAYAYTVTYDCGFYTGTAPASATATANASFTPPLAASGCNPCDSTTALTGWAVSGTSDVKTPGTAFTWDYDENKTFTAVWSKYPNIDNTDCVVGYKITLNCISNGAGVIDPCPAPRYLWTIPTVGAYLDPGRTQLMTSDAYNIVMPSRQPLVVNFDTNAPYNPAVNPTVQYTTNPATVATITKQWWYTMKTDDASNLINQYGFISSAGTNRAASRNADEAWRPTPSYGSSSTPNLSLTGYNFDGWYNNQNGTGTQYTRVYIPDNTPSPLYAHWTPKKYNVVYNKGAHATSGSTDYTDTNGATYDSPYTPLSFSSTPISNSMSARTGYVFVGWTTDSTPTFTNGNLDNEYTGDTYWKRDSSLTLYAAYECDTENGYYWNTGHTACINTYTLTYVANAPNGATVTGMPNPNPITLAYGTRHALVAGVVASGYTNEGWVCKDANDNTVPQFEDTFNNYQLSITMPASNVTCTAQWDTNIVHLKWYKTDTDTQQYTDGNPATSCQYGVGAISPLPTQPTRTGYSFAGWKVTGWECDLSVIDATINGNNSYIDGVWTWWADFSYGRLSGESKCIEQNAAPEETCATTGTKAEVDAVCNFCYCKLTAYTPTNGQQCNVTSTSWQHLTSFTGSCTDSCASWCGMYVKSGLGNNLRGRVLTQY